MSHLGYMQSLEHVAQHDRFGLKSGPSGGDVCLSPDCVCFTPVSGPSKERWL